MQGKVVVVTGSNVGIGLETAVGLAAMGATVVLACRNQDKAASAADAVRERANSDTVELARIDLADLRSVLDCAEDLKARFGHIDVLVNNAGGIWSQRQVTAQGFEQTFGVNHLGPFVLTDALLDAMGKEGPSRVVNVASVAHHWAKLDWDDLQLAEGYKPFKAYGRSKLANVLFTRALARRLTGTGVTANSLHPGSVASGFGLDGDLRGIRGLGNRLFRPFEISTAAGARTSIYVASAPELEQVTGGYFQRCKPGHPSKRARSDADAARLWATSEGLVAEAGFPIAGR
ncbi:MAG TPA: SDR family oxidoreductase [Acidimicrobiales bacterium]|nr:SDR family oxidoreductase [Acidimicrobiales bacterium]